MKRKERQRLLAVSVSVVLSATCFHLWSSRVEVSSSGTANDGGGGKGERGTSQSRRLVSKSPRPDPADIESERWVNHARRFITVSLLKDNFSANREMAKVIDAAKVDLRGCRLLAFVVAVYPSCPNLLKEELYRSCSAGVLADAADWEAVCQFVAQVEIPMAMAQAMGTSAGTAGLPVCDQVVGSFSTKGHASLFFAAHQRAVLTDDREAATDAIVAYVAATGGGDAVVAFLSPPPEIGDMNLLAEKFARSDSPGRESVLEIIRERRTGKLGRDMKAAMREQFLREVE